jgi:hypothetical protein
MTWVTPLLIDRINSSLITPASRVTFFLIQFAGNGTADIFLGFASLLI